MTRTMIERRLRALEGRLQVSRVPLAPDTQQAAIARLLEAEGLLEEEATARFGSVPAFVHWLMIRPNASFIPPTGDPFEVYRAMCR